MSFPEIKMGLDKPKGDTPPTFDEMRQAIRSGARDSALINQALWQADYLGLSGEDKYVLLAYHALVSLEEHHKRLSRVVMLHTNPMTILASPDQP